MAAVTRRRFLGALGTLIGTAAVGACSAESGAPPTSAPPPSVPRTTSKATPATPLTTTTTTTAQATPLPEIRSGVMVIARDAWGISGAAGFVEHEPVRITVHHTAVLLDDVTHGSERARQHQRYHRSLGWPDLAYHHLIDRAGIIYEGRPLWARGDTATSYNPAGHYLPCLEGDFDRQEPSDAQFEALIRLVAAVSDELGLGPDSITGHGDHATTSCPGSAVSSRLETLRMGVTTERGRHRLVVVAGSEAAELLSRISG